MGAAGLDGLFTGLGLWHTHDDLGRLASLRVHKKPGRC